MLRYTRQKLLEKVNAFRINPERDFFFRKSFKLKDFTVMLEPSKFLLIATSEQIFDGSPIEGLDWFDDLIQYSEEIKNTCNFKRNLNKAYADLPDGSTHPFFAQRDLSFNYPMDECPPSVSYFYLQSVLILTPGEKVLRIYKHSQPYVEFEFKNKQWNKIPSGKISSLIENQYSKEQKKHPEPKYDPAMLISGVSFCILKSLNRQFFLYDWAYSLEELESRWDVDNLDDDMVICPYYNEWSSV